MNYKLTFSPSAASTGMPIDIIDSLQGYFLDFRKNGNLVWSGTLMSVDHINRTLDIADGQASESAIYGEYIMDFDEFDEVHIA